MSTKRYTDEFEIEAFRQIVAYGRPAAQAAERMACPSTVFRLEAAARRRRRGPGHGAGPNAEVRRLKADLCHVTEEQEPPRIFFSKGQEQSAPS